MNSLSRAVLRPFASAAAGTITGILLAVVFGVEDKFFLNCFALGGAVCGLAPELAPVVVTLVKAYRSGHATEKTVQVESAHSPTQPLPGNQNEAIARHAKNEADRENRLPLCSHCKKKTSPIFQFRKVDGSADRRYRDNPLLCDKCFKLYAPERFKATEQMKRQ